MKMYDANGEEIKAGEKLLFERVENKDEPHKDTRSNYERSI